MDAVGIHPISETFAGVWERVTSPGEGERAAAPAPAPAGEPERLRGFITSESERLRAYSELSPRLRGGAGAAARRLADGSRRRSRRLRAWHFVLTGGDFAPRRTRVSALPIRDALRELCSGEMSAREEYLGARDDTRYPQLAELYAGLAESSSGRASAVAEIIGELL